jgi:hypothetical protein
MNLLAKFIIYPQLIFDDIPEFRLISIEILCITTMLGVVKRETGSPISDENHCWSDQQS